MKFKHPLEDAIDRMALLLARLSTSILTFMLIGLLMSGVRPPVVPRVGLMLMIVFAYYHGFYHFARWVMRRENGLD